MGNHKDQHSWDEWPRTCCDAKCQTRMVPTKKQIMSCQITAVCHRLNEPRQCLIFLQLNKLISFNFLSLLVSPPDTGWASDLWWCPPSDLLAWGPYPHYLSGFWSHHACIQEHLRKVSRCHKCWSTVVISKYSEDFVLVELFLNIRKYSTGLLQSNRLPGYTFSAIFYKIKRISFQLDLDGSTDRLSSLHESCSGKQTFWPGRQSRWTEMCMFDSVTEYHCFVNIGPNVPYYSVLILPSAV